MGRSSECLITVPERCFANCACRFVECLRAVLPMTEALVIIVDAGCVRGRNLDVSSTQPVGHTAWTGAGRIDDWEPGSCEAVVDYID